MQWLRLRASNAGVMGSIPGRGTQDPQAMWCGKKKKKISFISKTNHDFRDSGFGFGGKRRGLEAESAVSVVPTSLMPFGYA